MFGAGHPEFTVAYRWDAEAKAAVVDVKQTQGSNDATALFAVPIDFEFTLPRGKRETRRELCDAREQSFRFPLPARPEAFAFDPNADVPKTVKLDVPRAMLLHQLRHAAQVGARVAAARALARDAAPDVVEGLAAALEGDTFWGVRAEAAAALGQIKTDAAFAALVRGRKVAHPKARRAVASALGEFRGDEACRALEPLLASDPSYFVEEAAAASIGRTKSKRAFDLLRKALSKESFDEVIRCGVFAGFGSLGDERAIPIALEWTAYGRPLEARRAAVHALGKLGERRKDVVDALVDLLHDPALRVRTAAIHALGALGATAALPELDRIAGLDVDGRLKTMAVEAAQRIRSSTAQSDEVKRLRLDIDELRAANAKLLSKFADLEQRKNGRPRR